jgi:uncharacterized protein (TIGR00156 family)
MLAVPVIALSAFTGASSDHSLVNTVSEVAKLGDDVRVVLEGKIEAHIKDDDYRFRDNTGTITLDIDDDEWPAVNISENDRVRIFGETDASFLRRKVDVDRIEIIN